MVSTVARAGVGGSRRTVRLPTSGTTERDTAACGHGACLNVLVTNGSVRWAGTYCLDERRSLLIHDL